MEKKAVNLENKDNITITFPDGSTRNYAKGTTGYEVALSISPGLVKQSVAVELNERMRDLSYQITESCGINIIKRSNDKALELIRHDCAHVMAEAVQSLFPGTQVTIGPAIENGFYYDFSRDKPFSDEDLATIEKEMIRIIDNDTPFEREVWDRDEAIKHFESIGEIYKAEIIRDLPEDENLTIYRQGDWLDLCRGPHLPSTKYIGKSFKLMKIAGAYWRGDSRNEMLQRVYGTAWATEKELKQYLHRLEEADRRDHGRHKQKR